MYQRCASYLLYYLLPLLLVLTACGQQNVPQPTALPTATPPAVGQARFAQESQQAVDEFVRRQQMVDDTWHQIRDDFDRWSADLIACQPSAMHEALDEFATSFRAVTEHARVLTRTQATGALADILIASAEEEEEGFRRLRDYWQPNNIILFERVEEQRAQAAQAQRKAEDRAIELREALGEMPDSEAIEVFSQALELIKMTGSVCTMSMLYCARHPTLKEQSVYPPALTNLRKGWFPLLTRWTNCLNSPAQQARWANFYMQPGQNRRFSGPWGNS